MISVLFLLIGLLLGGRVSWIVCQKSFAREQSLAKHQVLEEKRALEEEIGRQKNVAFRVVFEAFRGGAATLDDQGHITGNNRALETWLGYEQGELVGRSVLSVMHPGDIEAVQQFFYSLIGVAPDSERAPHFSQELRFYTQEGAVLWIHLSLCPLRDADLRSQGGTLVLALLDDVTHRREVEGVAARLHAGVHDLYRVIADHKLNEQEQMRALLSLGCQLFDVPTGFLAKARGNDLEIIAAISPNPRLRVGQIYELGSEATHKRMELPAMLRSATFFSWRDRPIIAQTRGETFLGASIYSGQRFAGLLCFADVQERATPFGDEQTQFCQLMALWIGSEMERRDRQAQGDQHSAALLQSNARLETLATSDGLTGLKNRRTFDERMQSEWERAGKSGQPFSLLLLDVDKFKGFNDSFGHPAGDVVLKQVARLLHEGVRREATGENGFVARYGGEEFAVLLPATDGESAVAVGNRLRARIEAASWEHRQVTASFGVAVWTPTMSSPAQLLATSDAALYQSKEAGRNRVTLGKFEESAL